MEQSPSEANRFSANQENIPIIWNPKVHYLFFTKARQLSLFSARLIQSMSPLSYFLKIYPPINIWAF